MLLAPSISLSASTMSSFKKIPKLMIFIPVILLVVFIFYGLNTKMRIRIASVAELDVCRQPAVNVAFIRTHKTATGTLTNVFLRFADKYQRLVAFFRNQINLNHKEFNRSMLLGLKPGYTYNIFAEHAIFNYEEMRAVMPDDTKYITILRDPVAQFQSLYNYLYMELHNGISVSNFANLNISDPEESKIIKHRLLGIFGVNQIAFDLGIDPKLFDSKIAILEKIWELDKQFDLVMITELFDESLILMKEHLCWKDTNDVIYFKINARKPENKARLSSEQKENLRRMNRADQMIYDHFYKKLLRQIDAFGKEKMAEEVEKLRKATKEMYDLCVDEENSKKENEKFDIEVSFKLKKEGEKHQLCKDLTKNHFQLSADIFRKQKSLFTENEMWLSCFEFLKYSSSYLYFALRNLYSFVFRNTILSN